jgi:hypothetical protein
MRAGESATLTLPLTATSGQFPLDGGEYYLGALGVFNSGTVALQRLGADGLTFETVVSTASLTQAGGVTVDLPPGIYQVSLSTTGMSIYAEVTRINKE